MSTGTWPKEKESELVALRESGISVNRIAEIAGVSKQVASYHLLDVEPVTKLIDLLPSYPEEMLRIPEGSCALTSDWHLPYSDMRLVRRLFAVCLALNVRRLAIVGDFTDMSWLSRYLRKETRGSLAGDMRITLSVLDMLLNFFEEVWWLYGNHEDRLPAMLGGQDVLPAIGEAVAKRAKGKLHTSDMRTMLLGGGWRLEHPKTYSRDAAKVAAAAAAIFHRHIACAHGHHLGFRYDVSGEYLGVDLGGMFDADRQEYLFKSGITTLPVFNAGFWVYRNGKVQPFDDNLTDWSEYGTE